MKTKKQIADEAKRLADDLHVVRTINGVMDPMLIVRSMRHLAFLIHDLATVEANPTRTCLFRAPKCSEPATIVTGLCVAHSVRAMGDSIDRTVERKRRKK